MDKFEDAFKKISKVNLATHIELWGEPKTEKLYFEAGWQSRQSEFDAMTEALLNQTQLLAKKQAEVDAINNNHLAYIDKVIAMESDYLEKIEEKDKRIEEAQNHLNDVRNKGMDQSCYFAIKALRGEHE